MICWCRLSVDTVLDTISPFIYIDLGFGSESEPETGTPAMPFQFCMLTPESYPSSRYPRGPPSPAGPSVYYPHAGPPSAGNAAMYNAYPGYLSPHQQPQPQPQLQQQPQQQMALLQSQPPLQQQQMLPQQYQASPWQPVYGPYPMAQSQAWQQAAFQPGSNSNSPSGGQR